MTPKRSRREWLAGLKEGDEVHVVSSGGDRLAARVSHKRDDGLFVVEVPYPVGVLRFIELFRARDGYLKGRCLCSPRPRIEPVEGEAK